VPVISPILFRARVAQLRAARWFSDRARRPPFATTRRADSLPVLIQAHASPLRRRLGTTDPALQDGTIANLRLAVDAKDGLGATTNEVQAEELVTRNRAEVGCPVDAARYEAGGEPLR